MNKKLVAICISVVVVLAVVAILGNIQSGIVDPVAVQMAKSDVVIPMSASRPGCDETNWCYSPSDITTSIGKTITWVNEDSGLHTITSGYYDKPDGMFDSGHIDPGKTFSYKFEKSGDFHYYCRLHPWMEGTVIVQ